MFTGNDVLFINKDAAMPMVCITVNDYRELVEKAVRLDAITESIKQRVDQEHYSKVDDDIVLMMTGMLNYKKPEQPEKPEGKDE